MKLFFKIFGIARQRKYLRRTHAVSPFGETRKCAYASPGETSKCAYVNLKEKRVSALTVYFFYTSKRSIYVLTRFAFVVVVNYV